MTSDLGLVELVIQPTSFCNIDCSYCYLPERNHRKVLSPDQLGRIFDFAIRRATSGRLIVTWHCGEPLTLPIAYYNAAFEQQRRANKIGVRLTNVFQTNGTLLTPAWCRFFLTTQSEVGLSLDGPGFIHNATRRTRAGRPTQDRAAAAFALLRQHDIPTSVICVVTRRTCDHPESLFSYFETLCVRTLYFYPVERLTPRDTTFIDNACHPTQYLHFLTQYMSFISTYRSAQTVIPFNAVLYKMLDDRRPTLSQFATEPGRIVTVTADGHLSTFSPELATLTNGERTFVFTCCDDPDPFDFKSNAWFREVARSIAAGVTLCAQECEFFPICGGGMPINKLVENGTFESTETLACNVRVQATTRSVRHLLQEGASATARHQL